MWLQLEVLPELVQRSQVPLARLLNAHDFDGTEDCWYSVRSKGVGTILDAGSEDLNKVVIGEGAIGVAFQVGKVTSCWIRNVLRSVVLMKTFGEVPSGHLCRVVVFAEDFLHDLVCPFLITVRDSRVPSVHQIELGRNLVTNTQFEVLNFSSGVELPVAVGSIQVQDGADVVNKNNVDIQPARNEATRLEKVIVILIPRCLEFCGCFVVIFFDSRWRRRIRRWFGKTT